MVQNIKKRGRPPAFDRTDVVARAVNAFFESGYDGTTLADLEAATGVDRSTLYNSFGGKHGLYEMATSSYLDRAEASLFGPLHDREVDGWTAIREFIERLRLGLVSSVENSPGCLIVNDMAARSAPQAAVRYRQSLEAGLVAALERTGAPDTRARAGVLSTVVVGLNLVSKSTGDTAEVSRLIDDLVTTVESWQRSASDQSRPK